MAILYSYTNQYLSMAVQPFVGVWPLFQFLDLYHSRWDSLDGGSASRKAPAHRTTQTQNKCKQTSMLQVGFKPTIPTFERAKTVHALDCATTVLGTIITSHLNCNSTSLASIFLHSDQLSISKTYTIKTPLQKISVASFSF
jgi:hypothetical protein